MRPSTELPTHHDDVSERAVGNGSPTHGLTELLRHAAATLQASAVGITRASQAAPKYFTRSAAAAELFEDVCANGLETLKTQSQTKGGVFGTNRVRADSTGPVRGRLIATALRDPQGLPLGTLIAVRLIDEPRFGAPESQKLLAVARELEKRLGAGQRASASESPKLWTQTVPPRSSEEPAPATSEREPDAPTPHTAGAAVSVSVVAPPDPARSPAAPFRNDVHDPAAVTKLLTWSEFERHIRMQELDDGIAGCALYGDMDQLHVLNKLAGFAVGDRAIAEVGGALQSARLPAGSCACHLSGDRYTVYIPRTTLAQGLRIAEQLSKRVSGLSVPVHGVPCPLSISFGVALIPSKEGGLGHALAAVEAACKVAKDRGRGRVEVYQDADQSIVRRNDDVLVADRLRQALDAGRLEVFAQPIVSLSSKRASANYELLVRLIGEAGTHLSPTWFMSAATRYRMLVELDRAVVGQVLATLEAHRHQLASKQLRFSVNLSGPSIGEPDFLEWLATRIGGAGVPGEWLQFEITETAAVANIAQTQAMIRRLQARGVQFALDDFGTGVSSFAYLKFFEVRMLKLDGSFVRDLTSNPRSESLVRGIAQLGRGMNMETVAECVETHAVRDRLAELGVDCAQGFLFGRPKPFERVLEAELGTPPSSPATDRAAP